MNFRTRALSSAIIAVLATGSAIAADDPATAPDEAKNTEPKALDEIQVTATKRETPLQKTAIAITPISADTLDKERVTDVADITKLVPGFAATTQGDHDVITLTLRHRQRPREDRVRRSRSRAVCRRCLYAARGSGGRLAARS